VGNPFYCSCSKYNAAIPVCMPLIGPFLLHFPGIIRVFQHQFPLISLATFPHLLILLCGLWSGNPTRKYHDIPHMSTELVYTTH
jgi:hypothetical protein